MMILSDIIQNENHPKGEDDLTNEHDIEKKTSPKMSEKDNNAHTRE